MPSSPKRGPSSADPLPQPLACKCVDGDHDDLGFAHDPRSDSILMFSDAGGPTGISFCDIVPNESENVSMSLSCRTEVGSPRRTPYIFSDNNTAMTVAGLAYHCEVSVRKKHK